MRISDWSSDVCSSDLRAQLADGGRQFIGAAQTFAKPERHRRRLSFRVFDQHTAGLDLDDAIRGVAELDDIAGQTLEREVLVERADLHTIRNQFDFRIEQIGRASCRERVSKSVTISVVAVSLKK